MDPIRIRTDYVNGPEPSCTRGTLWNPWTRWLLFLSPCLRMYETAALKNYGLLNWALSLRGHDYADSVQVVVLCYMPKGGLANELIDGGRALTVEQAIAKQRTKGEQEEKSGRPNSFLNREKERTRQRYISDSTWLYRHCRHVAKFVSTPLGTLRHSHRLNIRHSASSGLDFVLSCHKGNIPVNGANIYVRGYNPLGVSHPFFTVG